ncbi:MAG: bifunctional biotin--[acetyl-CoA-carboxylase] ligase/biotin operon repressor BirA [Gammaproteobacteria bacterium]|nr:bifunctional biotin--[acetyl-CoA-carboxylase] ligase/biotin operon repressor BirA [Gammaproteobacteria bacterium]
MPLRSRLLTLLSDGEFHSGEDLGVALGVSRMAVWKHFKVLRELGVDFEVVRGKGYRLPAYIELLDSDQISSDIARSTATHIDSINVFHELDSTNNWLREQCLNGAPSGTVCLAEMQHAGRGRRGRGWVSPFAANLYLSLLWRSPAGADALGGLSLVAGIAVLRCLQAWGVEAAGLKWPNDILARNSKLAGILIDVVGETSGPCAVILGVGVNICMPPLAGACIDQSWTDLSRLTGCSELSRNRLAAGLLDHLLPAVTEFESAGLQPFLEEWRRYDIVNGCQVDLQLPNETVSGTACGIDDDGALLVETVNGRRRFASGELSVRFVS